MSLPRIEAVGNLTAPPELRFTPSGKAVMTLTVAASDGKKDDPKTKTTFLRCDAWESLAENIAESNLSAGTRVVITGRLEQRSFDAKDGTKKTVMEVRLDTFGVELRWQSATTQRSNGTAGTSRAAVADPWADSEPAF